MVIRILFLGLWLSSRADSSCDSCDIPKPYTDNLPANLVKDGDGIPNIEEDGDDTYLACPNMQWAMKKDGTGSILSSSDYIFCIENEWRTEGGVFIEEDDEFVCTIGKLDPQGSCKISLSGSFQDILKDTEMECQPEQTTVIKINGSEVAGQKLTCVKDGTVTIDGTTYNYQNTPNEIARIDCIGEPIRTTTTEAATTTTTIPSCCPKDGVWSEWTSTGACPTKCGSCNNANRVRTCESEVDGCPCTGLASDTGPCGIGLCVFPNKTCCSPYTKQFNNNTQGYFCGLESVPLNQEYSCGSSLQTKTPTTPIPSCCPKDGVWSEWSTGACPTKCGSCNNIAIRVRTCESEVDGCPCTGLARDTGPCGIGLCVFPNKTCCSPYTKQFNNNTQGYFCGLESVPLNQEYSCGSSLQTKTPTTPIPSCCPKDGVWSEWSAGACPTKCGSCNNIAIRVRTCESEVDGCPCTGLARDTGPCGIGLCVFPNKTCCSPYTKQFNNNTQGYFCGLESVPLNQEYSCGSSLQTKTPTTPIPSCCPKDGVWSEWSNTGSCATSCGSCNDLFRKRTCESEVDGCPCKGLDADIGPCGIALCKFPSKTCCSSYTKQFNNNTQGYFCGLESVPLNPEYDC